MLIRCNECGAEVSSNAPNCPKCGNPINPSKNSELTLQKLYNNKTLRTIVIVIAAILILRYAINSFNEALAQYFGVR